MMKEHVSIIIPAFNRANFLPQAIDSVLKQSYPHFELIIVDDGSVDHTAETVDRYGPSVRYIRQSNRGPAAARNKGINVARYDLLAFLDSDDRYAREKLELQLAAMQQNQSYLISHTQEVWYRNGVHLNQKKKHRKYGGDIFAASLRLCAVGMSTVMMRRKLVEKIGLFDESLPCCEDYDFWLRASVTEPFLFVDKPLTCKEGGRRDQVSSIYRVGIDKYRIRAICKLLEAGDLSIEQRQLALRELGTKCRIYGEGCLKHDKQTEGEFYLSLPETFM